MKTLWPVYEFRPLLEQLPPMSRGEDIFRFADGQWIPDDGEYDLAFIVRPYCFMVEIPYQKNIIWKGLTNHWTAKDLDHPLGGNPWHYMLREGETGWGGDWGRHRHQNHRAGDAGMGKGASMWRAATGWHVQFTPDDPHIRAGLLRERGSKAIVKPPEVLICEYCGPAWNEKRAAFLAQRSKNMVM